MKIVSEYDNVVRKKLSVGKVIGRFFILFGILIGSVLLLGLLTMGVLIHGPSKKARDIFVNTCMETSFAKYFPPMYLSNEEIAKIQADNSVLATTDVTNTDTSFEKIDDETQEEQKDMEIIDIKGSTYKGRMIIVKNPARVVTAAPKKLGEGGDGERLVDMLTRDKAVAGVNGGGFVDEGGMGNGSIPIGIVVKNSQFLYGDGKGMSNIIGFDENNVLHVGNMTSAQVKERKIRDAVSFGPSLIINSKPVKISGSGGGLNPRTAIGQRKDGSVLLLAIDGRQPHSLGANYKDLIDIMLEHGAVNAGNLDGGSSSMMIYNGESQTTSVSLYGARKIASGFMVLPE